MSNRKKAINEYIPRIRRDQSSLAGGLDKIGPSSFQSEESFSCDMGMAEESNPANDIYLEENSSCFPVLSQCTALLHLQFHESDETAAHFLEFYPDKSKRCLARSFTAGYEKAVEDVSLVFKTKNGPIAMSEVIKSLELFQKRNNNDWEQMILDLSFPADTDMDNWAIGWDLGYGSAIAILRTNALYLGR